VLDLPGLADLQAVDLELDGVKQRLGALDAALAVASGLDAIEAEIAVQAAQVQDAAQRRREAEATAAVTRDKITREEQRLYAGGSDARELQHLQDEVAALQRQAKTEEDLLLVCMDEEETERVPLTYLEALRGAVAEGWDARAKALRAERTAAASAADEVQAAVDEIRGELDADSLAAYDTARKRRARVISRVQGGVCANCRLTLPTTLVARARRGMEAVHGPNCACLLYVP